jgi:hypothetical protein
LEAAVVLDVILNEDHPAFSEKKLDPIDWPVDANGKPAEDGQANYGWIGMIKFRFLNSQVGDDKTQLSWALPMENTGITEYPLMNEVVIVGKYLNNYYYSRKLNLKSLINANASFELERSHGTYKNINEYTGEEYVGPISKLNGEENDDQLNPNYVGILGSYFKFNPAIRALKRYEGDSIIESRFGQSIRFGSYDETRGNDSGLGEYADGGGNPMLLIRNRQAPVKGATENSKVINKGYVTESINNDGSSIHITSGKTVSAFVPTTKKSMFSKTIKEEQSFFSPDGSTEFDYPKQDGDQIVINSDRLIFSSKANETLHFSKKRYAIVTDDEYTVDSNKQIVLTTNEMTSINSPMIYLGEAYQTAEPALLGRTTTLWNTTLCNWLLNQTNWMIELCNEWLAKHIHKEDTHGDKQMAPNGLSLAKLKEHVKGLEALRDELIALRDEAPKNMSQRVFLVGGGGAPGYKGGKIQSTPTDPNKPPTGTMRDIVEKLEEIDKKYEFVRVSSDTVV